MLHGDSASPAAAAYDAMLREVSDPASSPRPAPRCRRRCSMPRSISAPRASERLALASDSTNELKWAVVLILGVMTQISIGIVHLTKRNAQIGALTVFSIATVITLGLIALQEYPFAGDVRLAATPLQELLKLQGRSARRSGDADALDFPFQRDAGMRLHAARARFRPTSRYRSRWRCRG